MMQGHDPSSTEVNEKCTLAWTVQKECLQKKKLNAAKTVDFLSNIWPLIYHECQSWALGK